MLKDIVETLPAKILFLAIQKNIMKSKYIILKSLVATSKY